MGSNHIFYFVMEIHLYISQKVYIKTLEYGIKDIQIKLLSDGVMYTYSYLNTYAHVHTHIYTHIYTYIHIHIYTYTCIHT